MKRGLKFCPRLYFDCSSSEDRLTCEAHLEDDGVEVGSIIAMRDPDDLQLARVGHVTVANDLVRCGIGTRLYEQVFAEACKRGLRLASDTYRTRFSEAFWKKQVARGRAECVSKKTKKKRGGSQLDDRMDMTNRQWRCRQYAMKECPAVIDLSGTSKRIDWRTPLQKKRRRRAKT